MSMDIEKEIQSNFIMLLEMGKHNRCLYLQFKSIKSRHFSVTMSNLVAT